MRKSIIALLFLLSVIMFMPNVVKADTQEIEPNDSIDNANVVEVNASFEGQTIEESEDDNELEDDNESEDNNDYFKINLKKGKFYKITVSVLEGSEDLPNLYLYYDSDTSDFEIVRECDDKESVISKLFKPSYTGVYYLNIYSVSNTKYSVIVEDFDVTGLVIKDNGNNKYKITSNSTVEFSKAADKKVENDILDYTVFVSKIDNIKVLGYDLPFKITTIGKEAFKGCSFKSFVVNKDIYYIDDNAFANCKRLKEVQINGKGVIICDNAFNGCSNLKVFELEEGASLEYVGKNALKGTKTGIKIYTLNKKKYKKMFKKSGVKKPHYLIYL